MTDLVPEKVLETDENLYTKGAVKKKGRPWLSRFLGEISTTLLMIVDPSWNPFN